MFRPLRLSLRSLLFVALAGTAAREAAADLIHLKDGRKVVTSGAWSIEGDQVRYLSPIGRPLSLPLAEIDLEKSRAASPKTLEASGRAPAKAAAVEPSAEIVLYSTSWCPWCRRTRELFAAEGVSIVERDVEADILAAREKERLAPGSGVPVVTYGREVIRGFAEAELHRIAAAYRAAKAAPAKPRTGTPPSSKAD